jgi:hypothetical protein
MKHPRQSTALGLDAVGQIPISLIRWELTGELAPETARMLADVSGAH